MDQVEHLTGSRRCFTCIFQNESFLKRIIHTYSNKNNPAVDLIRKVIDNKVQNRITAYDFVQYKQYEKMELSLTNKPEKLMKNKLLKNYMFILDNQDTCKIEGKALVPVYLEETLSDNTIAKCPRSKRILSQHRRK